MPNRIFRDGFVDSEAVSGLSDWTHRLYSNLLVKGDDAGRADGRAEALRSCLFPLGTSRRNEDFIKALDEAESSRLIIRYTFGNKPYIQITKWQRCGRAEHSRFPWTDGSFEITYVKRMTRDGAKDFVSSSLIDDPMTILLIPGRNGKPPDTDTETETETKTDAPPPNGVVRSAEGEDPVNTLAKTSGIAEYVGPKQRGELRRLLAIDGFEPALEGLRKAMAKGITGGGAIAWAEKCVAGNKGKRDLNGARNRPVPDRMVKDD